MKAQVSGTLNIMTEAINDKYLGLPATLGLDKSDSFQYLIDRLILRLTGWKEKCLSSGGKEVLIKSVAQAIPSYAMSVFKIPKKICKGITDVISRFWWGDDASHKRMHWFSWWKMCIPKSRGGMGFRDIHCFNLALLAKQAWRLIDDPESLCAKILKAKYYPNDDLMNVGLRKKQWRSQGGASRGLAPPIDRQFIKRLRVISYWAEKYTYYGPPQPPRL